MTETSQRTCQAECPGFGRLVQAAFMAWKNAGVDFLVLRNYEHLPGATTNDVDVLVAGAQLDMAEQTLIAAAETVGYRLHNRVEFATRSIYLADVETCHQAHFDLFVDLRWHCFEYLSCRNFLARKIQRDGFWIPHPVDEACTNLLATFIYSGRVRDKYKPAITAAFRANPDAATALLEWSFGKILARKLVERAANEQWPAIERSFPSLQAVLLLRNLLFRPRASLAGLAKALMRWARRVRQPPGLMVVVLGCDGCGKSTVARAILAALSNTFPAGKSAHCHWKPWDIAWPRRKPPGTVTDPHGRPPRGRALSLLFFAKHWVEFCLGSLIRANAIMFRAGLVLVERYYYDFFVDQRRYRLQVPLWLVRIGAMFVKKPDLVLLLDAPPEVLIARKTEVTVEETTRQCLAYRKLVAGLAEGVVIDAAQPVEKVAADAVRAILNTMIQRARRRQQRTASCVRMDGRSNWGCKVPKRDQCQK